MLVALFGKHGVRLAAASLLSGGLEVNVHCEAIFGPRFIAASTNLARAITKLRCCPEFLASSRRSEVIQIGIARGSVPEGRHSATIPGSDGCREMHGSMRVYREQSANPEALLLR